MRLEYSLLWIDDQMAAVQDHITAIQEHIESQGFIANIEPVRMPTENAINQALSQNHWNIIVLDFNLGNTDFLKGHSLLKKIREEGNYTEVVLYSQDSVNIDKLSPLCEGLFINRGRGADLIEKIKKVIDLTLKKVMDLNVMRGIVLSSVAENDHLMNEIIYSYFTEGKEEYIKDKITKKHKEHGDTSKKELEFLMEDPLFMPNCLTSNFIDSETRRNILLHLCKTINIDELKKALKTYENVLSERNLLAHGRISDDRTYIFTKHDSKERKFYLKDALKLRIALMDFDRIIRQYFEQN
jgi:CheY-like chemotaxis protein